eukprot:9461277-Alexandrium_andersonii.AAC.1
MFTASAGRRLGKQSFGLRSSGKHGFGPSRQGSVLGAAPRVRSWRVRSGSAPGARSTEALALPSVGGARELGSPPPSC